MAHGGGEIVGAAKVSLAMAITQSGDGGRGAVAFIGCAAVGQFPIVAR